MRVEYKGTKTNGTISLYVDADEEETLALELTGNFISKDLVVTYCYDIMQADYWTGLVMSTISEAKFTPNVQ